MTQNVDRAIDRAVRGLFETEGRQTRNIKYYFRQTGNTADELADYRMRAHSQIEQGVSEQNTDLDSLILD